jgi:hypothetical protein
MFTVYKVVNAINGKYYIGVHKTLNPNDSYLGSGVAIKKAISKYGRNSFTKEVLLITENKEEAYNFEREATKDYNRNDNYNMKLGGVGGWSKKSAIKGGTTTSTEHKSFAGKRSYELGVGIHSLNSEEKREAGRIGGLANKGKPKSDETKAKISAALKGKKYNPRRPS